MSEPLKLLGIKINRVTKEETVQMVKNVIRSKRSYGHYICVANVHSVMSGRQSEKLRAALNSSLLTVADGMPLIWSAKFLGYPLKERIAGPDLMLELLGISEKEGHKNFFYGSSENILGSLVENLKKEFPGIKIIGSVAPPFRPLTVKEEHEIITRINEAAPDILWVGLGAPKQELWMAEHQDRLKVPLMIGVGAAFDFHAGYKKRAPLWMQKSGLEWAWRLMSEPRRLWKRYLIDDMPFFWYILKQKYQG